MNSNTLKTRFAPSPTGLIHLGSFFTIRDVLARYQPASKFKLGGEYEQRFHNAMNDDFNTPEALAVLFNVVREINNLRESNTEKAAQLAALLRHLGAIIGLLQENSGHYFKGDGAADGIGSGGTSWRRQ
ncbi:MAG: hypothetical protein L3J70_05585 [Gammaproteobacteria bacterium]|nr:hypothetical protein [Gammaproteobacteria bacterium]